MRPPNRPSTSTGMHWTAATTPSIERVAGQLEDEPALGDGHHPRPDQRQALAGEEEAVVAMAHRAPALEPGDAAEVGRRAGHGAVRSAAGDRRPARARARRGGARDGRGARRRQSTIDLQSLDLLPAASRPGGRSASMPSRRTARRSRRVRLSRNRAPIGRAGGLVLEQPADLGEAEAGVVAEALMNCRRARSSASYSR